MAMCSKDGHAPWVECGHGKGWTKKKPASLEEKNMPYLQCGGGVRGFFVRALRVATQQSGLTSLLKHCCSGVSWMCSTSLMLSSLLCTVHYGCPLSVNLMVFTPGVLCYDPSVSPLLQAFWCSLILPPYHFTNVDLQGMQYTTQDLVRVAGWNV